MAYIILGIIIGLLMGYLSNDGVFGCIIGAIAGFMISILIFGMVGSIVGAFLPTKEVVETKEIFALIDSSETEGQKFLFSGYIEEDLVYRYIVNTKRGKHIEECEVENSYIQYNELENPYVEYHETKFKEKWYWWFAIDHNENSYNIFYVPSGTITNEYNIDLK